jgi:hypothetical protein
MDIEPVELFAEMRSSVIRLELSGVSREYNPSFEVTIHVDDEGFSGWGTFWIYLDEWKAFLQDLMECERTRRGLATLEGMGPGERLLTLSSTDSLGHFTARYVIKRHRAETSDTVLIGGFPLDVSCFGHMVSGFRRLDEAVHNSR